MGINEYETLESPQCAICGCILDRFDDETFVCNDVRCQRAWEDRCDEAEERRIQRIQQQQEY